MGEAWFTWTVGSKKPTAAIDYMPNKGKGHPEELLRVKLTGPDRELTLFELATKYPCPVRKPQG